MAQLFMHIFAGWRVCTIHITSIYTYFLHNISYRKIPTNRIHRRVSTVDRDQSNLVKRLARTQPICAGAIPCLWSYCCVLFLFFLFVALLFCLPLSHNSDPSYTYEQYDRLPSPIPTTHGSCFAFLSREDAQAFLPWSSRVELRLPRHATKALLSSRFLSLFIFARKHNIALVGYEPTQSTLLIAAIESTTRPRG